MENNTILMEKQAIDKVLTDNWDLITTKINGYLKYSKTSTEADIIGYSYEELMKNKKKLKKSSDVLAFFLNTAKMTTKWYNCQYFKHNDKKQVNMDNDEILEYFDNLNEEDEVDYEPNVIDKFLEIADTQEKLVLNLMLQGYSTSGKLSNFTKIPRTTCYYLITNIKNKLKEL